MDTIASIAEADATAEVAATFADIRKTLEVPATNLIWRHLATIDGALNAVWSRIKPLYTSRELREAAQALRVLGATGAETRRTRLMQAAVNLQSPEVATIIAVFENYDRTNPLNLVAFRALLARMNGASSLELPLSSVAHARSRPKLAPLPPLMDPANMSAATVADALALNNLGVASPASEIVAGVPRHLANWPTYLRRCVDALSPYEIEIAHCIKAVERRAGDLGFEMAGHIEALDESVPRREIERALSLFCSADFISNYIVKVRWLMVGVNGSGVLD